jgi:hypothetical protein
LPTARAGTVSESWALSQSNQCGHQAGLTEISTWQQKARDGWAQDGLCVVVPKGFDERKIPSILKQKKVWIADAMKRVGETRRFLEPLPAKDHLCYWPCSVKLGQLFIAKTNLEMAFGCAQAIESLPLAERS